MAKRNGLGWQSESWRISERAKLGQCLKLFTCQHKCLDPFKCLDAFGVLNFGVLNYTGGSGFGEDALQRILWTGRLTVGTIDCWDLGKRGGTSVVCVITMESGRPLGLVQPGELVRAVSGAQAVTWFKPCSPMLTDVRDFFLNKSHRTLPALSGWHR